MINDLHVASSSSMESQVCTAVLLPGLCLLRMAIVESNRRGAFSFKRDQVLQLEDDVMRSFPVLPKDSLSLQCTRRRVGLPLLMALIPTLIPIFSSKVQWVEDRLLEADPQVQWKEDHSPHSPCQRNFS